VFGGGSAPGPLPQANEFCPFGAIFYNVITHIYTNYIYHHQHKRRL
jgi:hypothetical protein